jgi:dsDNA-specific endonuclease/ATPase MutS2
LYDQLQAKEDACRVVYGFGTGVLQKKTLEYLHKHPLVDTIVEQGGSCIILFN